MISQVELKLLFIYDADSGHLFWRESGKGRKTDIPAGTLNNHGYIVITVDGQRYLEHILVWILLTSKAPEKELDHKDGIGDHNWFTNLREVTHSQNLMNSKTRTDNTSGKRGVCWNKQKNKWKVQLTIDGKRRQWHFSDIEEASNFRDQMAFNAYGEYMNHAE